MLATHKSEIVEAVKENKLIPGLEDQLNIDLDSLLDTVDSQETKANQILDDYLEKNRSGAIDLLLSKRVENSWTRESIMILIKIKLLNEKTPKDMIQILESIKEINTNPSIIQQIDTLITKLQSGGALDNTEETLLHATEDDAARKAVVESTHREFKDFSDSLSNDKGYDQLAKLVLDNTLREKTMDSDMSKHIMKTAINRKTTTRWSDFFSSKELPVDSLLLFANEISIDPLSLWGKVKQGFVEGNNSPGRTKAWRNCLRYTVLLVSQDVRGIVRKSDPNAIETLYQEFITLIKQDHTKASPVMIKYMESENFQSCVEEIENFTLDEGETHPEVKKLEDELVRYESRIQSQGDRPLFKKTNEVARDKLKLKIEETSNKFKLTLAMIIRVLFTKVCDDIQFYTSDFGRYIQEYLGNVLDKSSASQGAADTSNPINFEKASEEVLPLYVDLRDMLIALDLITKSKELKELSEMTKGSVATYFNVEGSGNIRLLRLEPPGLTFRGGASDYPLEVKCVGHPLREIYAKSLASGLKSVLYDKDIIRIIYVGKLMMLLHKKYKVDLPQDVTRFETVILDRYIDSIVDELYTIAKNNGALKSLHDITIKALLKIDIVAVCESFVELLPPDSGITQKEYEACFDFKSIKNKIPKTRKSDKEAYESVTKLKQIVANGITDYGPLYGSE